MTPQQLIIRAAGLTNTALLKTHWPLFFTLTYRDGETWKPEQISTFIANYRMFIKRKLKNPKYKLTYVWTAENHKNRDYIHYHGIIWVPNGILPPKPNTTERTRKAWWPYGRTNVQRARNPAVYIAKYIGKSNEPLKIQKRARTYSINVRNIINLDYFRAPNWTRYWNDIGDVIKRVPGYGLVNFTQKIIFRSPYRFLRGIGCINELMMVYPGGEKVSINDYISELTPKQEFDIFCGVRP